MQVTQGTLAYPSAAAALDQERSLRYAAAAELAPVGSNRETRRHLAKHRSAYVATPRQRRAGSPLTTVQRIMAVALIALGMLALPMVPLSDAVPESVIEVTSAVPGFTDLGEAISAEEADALFGGMRKKLRCLWHLVKIGIYPLLYAGATWLGKTVKFLIWLGGWWAVAGFVIAHIYAFWHVRGIANHCR